jgi:hypothetical protein
MHGGRHQWRCVLGIAAVWGANVTAACAGNGDSKATTRPDAGLEQTSYVVESPMGWVMAEPEPFALPSKYYGPWEPTEVFGHDARCAPTPYAPRGHGFPKKLSPYRMDYTPYRVRDCAIGSVHGPALWWRRHRDPCCDPVYGGCRKCATAVDPQ